MRNPELKARTGCNKLGGMSLATLEDILDLSRTGGGIHAAMRGAITHSGGGRRVIQWGALGDPFDNIERHHGLGKAFISLFQQYGQPVRVSTKGGLLLQQPEYLALLAKRPELFWFAFSCITVDDVLLSQIDRRAPNATERLKAMAGLTKLGCRASIRMRPILKNVTDTTPAHPKAWQELLRRARDAGAEAVSMEFVFVPGAEKPGVEARWNAIEEITRFPYRRFYKKTSDKFSACLRSSRWWKEELTFAIREEAHALGMVFSISDPHWKELNDTGCCCGIKDTDPVFGNWEKKQACQALLNAKADFEAGGPGLLHLADVVPDWAKRVMARSLLCVVGPKGTAEASRTAFGEYHHRHIWNDLNSPRGPYIYFGGIVKPCGKDENGDLVYQYVGQERKHGKYGWGV
jgi:DNA repair photolyase